MININPLDHGSVVDSENHCRRIIDGTREVRHILFVAVVAVDKLAVHPVAVVRFTNSHAGIEAPRDRSVSSDDELSGCGVVIGALFYSCDGDGRSLMIETLFCDDIGVGAVA